MRRRPERGEEGLERRVVAGLGVMGAVRDEARALRVDVQLGVELRAVDRRAAEAERLERRRRVGRQLDTVRRKGCHAVVVAHLRVERVGDAGEERVRPSRSRHVDRVRAHLGAARVVDDRAAEGAGEKLVPPARPERRHRALGGRLAEPGQRRRPRERVDRRVGARAADQERVDAVERGYGERLAERVQGQDLLDRDAAAGREARPFLGEHVRPLADLDEAQPECGAGRIGHGHAGDGPRTYGGTATRGPHRARAAQRPRESARRGGARPPVRRSGPTRLPSHR